jgi:hypothetical protein
MIEDYVLIISAISASSAAGGLIFNGLAHLKESKTKHYQIMKDLQIEFDVIETKYPGKNEINKETKEVLSYKRDYCGFFEKLAYMRNNGIVPEKVAEYYDTGFQVALMYLEKLSIREEIESGLNNMMDWCYKKQITAYPQHEDRNKLNRDESKGIYQDAKGTTDSKPFGKAKWVSK